MKRQKNSRAIALASALCAAALLVEFVRQVSEFASNLINNKAQGTAFYVLPVLISCFSLFSCFYFAFCALSYSKASIDLKKLGFLHMMPMLWAGARVVYLIYEDESPIADRWLLLKYILLTVLLIYFYLYFSRLLDASKGTKILEICSFVLVAVTLMYLIQTIIMLFKGKCALLDINCVLAFETLLMCPYALLFKTGFITPEKTENS